MTANYSGNTVQVLWGAGAQSLALDTATGLRNGAGRGMLFNDSDVDYWSFSGQLNDRLTLAVENPGAPANSSLRFYIYRPDGSQMADFYQAANNGAGEYSSILPASGTYTIYVTRYNNYYGEYRLRVTLAPPPLQYETEDNNSLDNADPVAFALLDGKQTASVYGYFSIND